MSITRIVPASTSSSSSSCHLAREDLLPRGELDDEEVHRSQLIQVAFGHGGRSSLSGIDVDYTLTSRTHRDIMHGG